MPLGIVRDDRVVALLGSVRDETAVVMELVWDGIGFVLAPLSFFLVRSVRKLSSLMAAATKWWYWCGGRELGVSTVAAVPLFPSLPVGIVRGDRVVASLGSMRDETAVVMKLVWDGIGFVLAPLGSFLVSVDKTVIYT